MRMLSKGKVKFIHESCVAHIFPGEKHEQSPGATKTSTNLKHCGKWFLFTHTQKKQHDYFKNKKQ